jgi:hypothetical protein
MKKFKKVTWRGSEGLYVTDVNENVFVNISNPMISLVRGEDEFTAEDIEDLSQKTYDFNGEEVRIEPHLYMNGFVAVAIIPVLNPYEADVITVNLDDMGAFSIPSVIWADINNHPNSEGFLEKTGMARKTPMTKRSGYVNYPVMIVDLAKVYAHNPEIFKGCDLIPDPEDYISETED